jgi:hypothetical protein
MYLANSALCGILHSDHQWNVITFGFVFQGFGLGEVEIHLMRPSLL